ncbi:MAG TPA: hypothetical protein VK146_11740, partial [Tabrizicola sp.]|nr:hypothetical protein [Tabrizicola sp.]
VLVTLDTEHKGAVDLLIRQLRRRLPAVKLGLAQWHVPEQGPAAPRKGAADFTATSMEELFSRAFGKDTAAA